MYLANIASEVILVHRRDELRSEKILQTHLFEKAEEGKVKLMWNHTLDEVLGDKTGVTGMRVKHTQTGETQDIAVHGDLRCHRPQTEYQHF